MTRLASLPLGQIIPVPNMRVPKQGAQAIPFICDFNIAQTLEGDLRGAFDSGVFDIVQSVFIDNKDNAGTFTLTMPGAGPNGSGVIQAQPYTQGYYPVSPAVGDGRFSVFSGDGEIVPVTFYNVPMPYFVWGPTPGVLIVPSLTNLPVLITPTINGDNQLVAGGANAIKLYRGVFSVDAPAVLKFTDGPGGALLFATQLTAGGSLFFQPSGIPWFVTTPGNDLTVNVSAAVNMYGGFGYVG